MTKLAFVEELYLPAPADIVFGVTEDVQVLVACVPGASLTGVEVDGFHHGKIDVSFGPTKATFRGRVRFTREEETKSGRLEAQGTDARGATRAKAILAFEVRGVGSGAVAVLDVEIEFVGALARFMTMGGRLLAQHLLEEFAVNFRGCVEGRQMANPMEPSRGTGLGAAVKAFLFAGAKRLFGRSRRLRLRRLSTDESDGRQSNST